MRNEQEAHSSASLYRPLDKPTPIQLDSPIEFALVGVINGQIRLIAQSSGARIDLLEGAISGDINEIEEISRKTPTSVIGTMISALAFGNSFIPKNIAFTRAVAHSMDEEDERYAMFTLFWRGYRTSLGLQQIRREFARLGTDIYIATHTGTISEFSLILADTIARCARSNSRGVMIRRISWFAVVVYISMGFAVAATALLADRFNLN